MNVEKKKDSARKLLDEAMRVDTNYDISPDE